MISMIILRRKPETCDCTIVEKGAELSVHYEVCDCEVRAFDPYFFTFGDGVVHDDARVGYHDGFGGVVFRADGSSARFVSADEEVFECGVGVNFRGFKVVHVDSEPLSKFLLCRCRRVMCVASIHSVKGLKRTKSLSFVKSGCCSRISRPVWKKSVSADRDRIDLDLPCDQWFSSQLLGFGS